jgi:hypothetical protein
MKFPLFFFLLINFKNPIVASDDKKNTKHHGVPCNLGLTSHHAQQGKFMATLSLLSTYQTEKLKG